MYITRHMEKPVMELNEQYPVLLLTGPKAGWKNYHAGTFDRGRGQGAQKGLFG